MRARVALIEDDNGILYGAAYGGTPVFGGGTVFKMNRDGTGFGILHGFLSVIDGALIENLIQGTDGLLYGTTAINGNSGIGGIFRLDTDGTNFEVVYKFQRNDDIGFQPAGLTQGGDGAFYGTLTGGIGRGAGQAFRLAVQMPQTITFNGLPDKVYGDPAFNVSASATSGLAVTFSAGGDCSISGTTVTITGAGSSIITADQPGSDTYFAAPASPRVSPAPKPHR